MMKKSNILKALGGIVIAAAAVFSSYAAGDGIIETRDYSICPGDTITVTTGTERKVVVFKDTTWFDTIQPSVPNADSVYKYVVHVYPRYEFVEHKELETGQSLTWCGLTITQAGEYEKRFQSIHGCDSIRRLVVTEHVYTSTVERYIARTLCEGSSFSFGGQQITEAGEYRDTIHLSHYDSVTILTVQLARPDTTLDERRISQGQSTTWNGNTYSTPGIYEERLTNRFGCDSILRLVLTVVSVDTVDEEAVICKGVEYPWRGQTLHTAGTYYAYGQSATHDDIVYRLTLKVNNTPTTYVRDTICQGGSITFGDQTLTTSGIYTHTYNVDGCDSTVVLSLIVAKPDTTTDARRITKGEYVTWNGINRYESGIYDSTFVNNFGCESLARLILTVVSTDTIDEDAVICKGTDYAWRGQTLHNDGIYYAYGKSATNDDIVYRLTLVTQNTPTTYVTDTICKGGSITFGEQTLTTSGVYTHTYNINGCDSTVVLTLLVVKPDTTLETSTIPQGQTITWNGNTYDQTGVYDYLTTNRFGCDSLAQLLLTVYPIDTIDTTVVICPSTSFSWHGMTHSATGNYEAAGVKENGEKVIYRLHLTVKELVTVDTTFTLCDEESISFHGNTYVNAGTYDIQHTCDTVYRVTIVKHVRREHESTGVLDRDHPYYWQYELDGQTKVDTLTQAGVYIHNSLNPETGCNDVWRLILTKNENSYHFDTIATICENEYFEWRGMKILNRQGIGQTTDYYDPYLTVVSHQDSIYHLTLTVYPVPRTTRTIPFCGSIDWNGELVTETKTIIDTLVSLRYHCDSIVTTNLVKGVPFYHHDTVSIQVGETLVWRGMTIDHDGQYEDRFTSSYGCDSIYSLGVGYKYNTPGTTTVTEKVDICEGDFKAWRGDKYYNSGTYIDTVYQNNDPTTGVIDKLYVLILNVHSSYSKTERVTFLSFPQTYREQLIGGPGEYTFTYQSTFGCDSIITAYIDQEVYRDEQTVVICPDQHHIWDYDGESYNVQGKYTKVEKGQDGNDSVIHVLNLIVRYIPVTQVEATICQGQTYVFGDQTLTQSGVYTYAYHTTGGCDSTVQLSLNVLSPDTTFLAIQREQGASYVWGTQTITEPGTYFHYGTNRFGCDSVAILEFTYNQVDTIEEHVTVCPNELPYVWNGIQGNQTQHYTKTVQQPSGNYIYYSLYLTVREIQQVDTTFTICDDGSVSFNGKTYSEAGHFRDWLSCDTMMNITIVKHPQQVYVTNATITDDHGYTWTYWENGTEKTQTFNAAGTYEFESPNATTGCSEIWRLILTKDETEYHFVETVTICEGDDFSWRGRTNLSSVPGYKVYQDPYETRAGKDSIYELHLTVVPVERTVRTVVFCGETTWNGKTITTDTVVYDTVPQPSGCYRIERTNFDKQNPFYHEESKSLPQGTVLHWHGQNITTDGTYYDFNTTVAGCDSIYKITVTIVAAGPETNQYAEELSTCEGDTIEWRGKHIWRSGTYVDTVYKAGTQVIDSIFALHFTAWPAPKDTIYRHMYTCNEGSSIRYNGKDYYQDTTIVTKFQTIHGCDSVVKVFMHFNTALYHKDTARIAENMLPYEWRPVPDTTINLMANGTYQFTQKAEGGCNNIWELYLEVYPLFIFEDSVSVCEADLPYHWDRGPADHASDGLSGTAGQTTLITYTYSSVLTGADSLYRLKLYVMPQVKHIEQLFLCEGEKVTLPNGKEYVNLESDSIYRDTVAFPNPNMPGCDSIVYYEIQQVAALTKTETKILHVGETINWHGQTITSGGMYHDTKTGAAAGGCDSIYYLNAVQEMRQQDTICVLDTPYVWRGKNYYTTAIWTDTVRDGQDLISEYHSLDLTVLQVPYSTIQLHLCDNNIETLPNGKTYNGATMVKDSLYRDTIVISSPTKGCDSTVYYEIIALPLRTTIETQILHVGETIEWKGLTISDPITKTYNKDSIDENTGCKIVNQLRVIAEHREKVTICAVDTPYVWSHNIGVGVTREDSLYSTGIYTDTIFNSDQLIENFNTLDLTVMIPVDTLMVLRGCQPQGVTWNGKTYLADTIFRDTLQTCDTLYTVKIKVDTTYTINIDTTICEQDLPFILGRQNPDTIWGPTPDHMDNKYVHKDTTACGCDSIVNLTLTIVPSLSKNDSTFVCEDWLNAGNYVWLGDTVDPWFEHRENGKFSGKWQGKWFGVPFSEDTIVYNCDSSFFHHIIVRPHQAHIPEYHYSLCQGDSVQLFLPYDTTWVTKAGIYLDTVPTISAWQDLTHNTTIHNDRAYACDSVTRWIVTMTDTLHVHQYKHIRQGDTYRFNDSILSTTGVYDSIGYYQDIIDPLAPTAPAVSSMDSSQNYCKAVYTLHLTVDSVYKYGDTIEICMPAGKEYTHSFDDDQINHYEFKFNTPDKDTAIIHLSDSLKHLSYEFYDHFYDLVVYYKQQYFKQIKDTICYGDSIQFDQHHLVSESNVTTERYLKKAGVYVDTLRALNGCDSIIELRLFVRDRIDTVYSYASVVDRELPYLWHLTSPSGNKIDSLYTSGTFYDTLQSVDGCDSIVGLRLTVRPTYLYRDTVDTCAAANITLSHVWPDGYEQFYTTPSNKDTANITYKDTMIVSNPPDSVFYELYVRYYRTYETHVYDTICAGDSAHIDSYLNASLPKKYYKETGIYRDTTTTIYGCDSIVTLHLQVWPSFPTRYKEVDVNEADTPYLWIHSFVEAGVLQRDTDSITMPGNYGRHLYNIHGCDSIDSITVRIHPNYRFEDTVTVCGYEVPYVWKGPDGTVYKSDIYDSGTYTRQWRTANGFGDSTRVLKFRVLPILYTLRQDTLCYGDSILFGKENGQPRYIHEPGIYFDTLTSFEHGCDSVIEMRLNVFDKYMNKYTRHIMRDELPYKWYHVTANTTDTVDTTTIISEGQFEYIFHTPFGCDSIDSLTLVVHDDYLYRDSVTICADERPYTWYGPDGTTIYRDGITQSGEYQYTLRRVDGLSDSTLIRKVTVNPILHSVRYDTLCYGDSIPFGLTKNVQPRIIKEPGVYHDTLTSVQYGCDSIVEMRLNFFPNYNQYHSAIDITDAELPYKWYHYQAGSTVAIDSTEIHGNGTFEYVFKTSHDCDSTDHLTVHVHPNYLFRDTVTICSDATPYTWYGPDSTVYKSDIYDTDLYTHHMRTADGNADSIYTRQVNVIPVKHTIIRDSICADESHAEFYLFKGQQLKVGGVYHDTLTAASGCDSIVTLYLTVNKPYYNYIERHIVEGYSTTVFGKTYDKDTVFSIIGTTPNGCDSVTDVKVIMHPMVDTIVHVCSTERPYLWENKWTGQITPLYTAGIYRNDTTYDANGKRLFYGLQLIVDEPSYSTITRSICEGDSIRFGLSKANKPRFLYNAGTYTDTLVNAAGCDSIITLTLNVYPKFFNDSIKHIADTDTPYVWIHKQGGVEIARDSLYAAGDYGFRYESEFGCDSIDSLHLFIHQTYYITDDTIRICAKETPFTWRTLTNITETGDYIEPLFTTEGYDSIHYVHIEVAQQTYSTITRSICEGDSIRFGLSKANKPRFLYNAGTYTDTLVNAAGCDSIITLTLNVYPKFFNDSIKHIADTDTPYVWIHKQGGVEIARDSLYAAGDYGFRYESEFGCDSIDSLHLFIHQTYYITDDTIRICAKETPFTWRTLTNITETGDYIEPLFTAEGYDSIHYVHIEVAPQIYKTIQASICKGDSYWFKNEHINEAGTYIDTTFAANGCDSVTTLILTVNEPYFNTRTEHIIEGNSVEFFGQTYTETGTYTHYGRTPEGCDSTSILQLVVHPMVDTIVTVCKNDMPYIWENKWTGVETPLYEAGLYRNDTTYINGERVFYGLQLVVNSPVYDTIRTAICEGDSYWFKGEHISEAGIYRDTTRAANGCDSVTTLVLTVNQITHQTIVKSIYQGESVVFEGNTYSQAGSYPIRYTSVLTGCDSIIELRLSVTKLFDDSITVCYSELPYEWHHQTIYESGIYRDTAYNSLGESTVTGIKVTVLPIVHNETPLLDTICQGDTYLFGIKKRELTESGTYYDTLTSVRYGCDSIVSLILYVQPIKYQTDQKTIFAGDSVLFFGKWYKEGGIYNYREPVANGRCFNTYQLILTVIQPVDIDTTAIVCENELPFIWHGHEYNTAGTHTLPISWTDTSRITMTLNLQINPVPREDRVVDLCDGSTFIYKGKEHRKNETFYDTIPSLVGCDSIIKFIVRVHPTYDRIDTVHISDKKPYQWNGRTLNLSGEYEWTGSTIHGCDSMEHLVLIVHPSFFQSDTVELCQSDSLNYPFVWKDEDGRVIKTITESGTYSDSVLTQYGFDSVHQVVVYVRPSYFTKEQYEIGEGEILKIHGRDISKPAIYFDTLRTIYGCDSIFHVVVNAKRTREFTWNKTICQGDYYDFFGEKKTTTGNYTYVSQYKDSIVYLHLTVNPRSYSEKRIVITDKQTSYIYNGLLYENLHVGNNLFADTTTNQYGCDSIYRLIICVTSRYSDWDPIPLCPGGEVKIDGQIITKAGLYTFERRSRVTGEMDSLYRVEVYDAPAFDMPTESITLCQGDTCFFAGKKITRAGHYDFAMKTINGCDSLLHLDLTINPSYQFYTDATIADYESYQWRGKEYTKTGNYDISFPTILDCDSTYTLRLTVVETKRHLLDDTICIGQTYTWRGREITEEGYYTDTVRRLETGNSAIYTLQLTILYPTSLTSATVGEVCANGESFDIAFTYSGAKPTTYSIYFDQLAKNEGFKDVINKPFLGEDRIARAPVPSKQEVIYLEHTAYVKPNRYTMRLVLDNGVCGISRSDTLVLLVKYPNWIIEQNWDDVVAPLKPAYNGGYDFVQTDWYVNGVLQPNNGLGYLHSDKLKEGDEVVMVATRKGESFSIPTCPLTIQQPAAAVYTDPILVYPTQAPHYAPQITIEAPQGGKYAIFTSTGTLLVSDELVEGLTQVTLPASNGIYFIRTANGNETMTHKVVLY